MAKGPDPRASPAPLHEVPALLAEGAAQWNARRFWHAHEAWETAWHALRALSRDDEAEFVHGMILCAAALENATRGKEDGFRRQCAEGLYLMRANMMGSPAALRAPARFVDALAHLYVDACRRLEWSAWNASGWSAPALEIG